MTTSPDSHLEHDPELIAALLDRDASGPDRDRATALAASCNACARLHADLVALTAAVRVQPTPARPRDFSITPEDAARLRRGRGWRRLLALGGPRDRVTRPLALGLTTLGVAGLLLANIQVPVGGFGSSAAATSAPAFDVAGTPQRNAAAEAAPTVPPPAATGAPDQLFGAAAGAGASAVPTSVAAPAASSRPAAVAEKNASRPPAATGPGLEGGQVTDQQSAGPDAATGEQTLGAQAPGSGPGRLTAAATGGAPSLLLAVSVACLVIGVGLLLLRASVRRLIP